MVSPLITSPPSHKPHWPDDVQQFSIAERAWAFKLRTDRSLPWVYLGIDIKVSRPTLHVDAELKAHEAAVAEHNVRPNVLDNVLDNFINILPMASKPHVSVASILIYRELTAALKSKRKPFAFNIHYEYASDSVADHAVGCIAIPSRRVILVLTTYALPLAFAAPMDAACTRFGYTAVWFPRDGAMSLQCVDKVLTDAGQGQCVFWSRILIYSAAQFVPYIEAHGLNAAVLSQLDVMYVGLMPPTSPKKARRHYATLLRDTGAKTDKVPLRVHPM